MAAMPKPETGWVVYMRDQNGAYVRLTKPLKTKQEAEARRTELMAQGQYKKLALGVGFVR
jgi:hypothetical protein